MATLMQVGDVSGAQTAGPLLSALNPSDIHVLLVDDERLTRLVVGNLLRTCKYKVTIAESGTQALEVLSKAGPGAFQLILTDVMMPDVGGLELLRFVRGHQHHKNVPVIMMSASEEQETMCAALLGSADEYLVKPVTRKEVQNIWMHVMKRYHAAAAQPAAAQEGPQDAGHSAAAGAAMGSSVPFLLPGGTDGTAAPGFGAAGGRGSLLSLGLAPGMGLPPQVAHDMMRAAALAASTTATADPADGLQHRLAAQLPPPADLQVDICAAPHGATAVVATAGTTCGSSAGAAAAAAAAATIRRTPETDGPQQQQRHRDSEQHPVQQDPAAGPVAGGAAPRGQAAVAAGGNSRGPPACKVNLLKWLRRPTRCVQPKESFRIFCEVLLLLDSVHQTGGARPCGLRPSKLVLYSTGRVAFASRQGAAASGALAAHGPTKVCGAADVARKRRRRPSGDPSSGACAAKEETEEPGGACGAVGAGGRGGGSCVMLETARMVEAGNEGGPGQGPGHEAEGQYMPLPPEAQPCQGSSGPLSRGPPPQQQQEHPDREKERRLEQRRLQNAAAREGRAASATAAAAPPGGTAAERGDVVMEDAAAAAVAAVPDDDEDALYRSPEEERGQEPTAASDMFSLGLLFFELFYSCSGQERAALLRDARQRQLPAAFGRQQPKEAAFALALLHPEASSRPTLEELLGSAMFRATCASLRQRGQQRAVNSAGTGTAGTGAAACPGGGGEPHPDGQSNTHSSQAQQRQLGGSCEGHDPHRGLALSRVHAVAKAAAKPHPPHRLANASSAAVAAAAAAAGCPAFTTHGAGLEEAQLQHLGQGGVAAGRAGGGAGGRGGSGGVLSPSSSRGALPVDDAVLLEFLKMVRRRKLDELSQVESELASLTADAQIVEQYLQYLLQTRTAKRQRGAAAGNGGAAGAAEPAPAAAAETTEPTSQPHDHGSHNDSDAAAAAAAAAGADPLAAPYHAAAPLLPPAQPAVVAPLSLPLAPPVAHSAAWSEQHQAAQSKWCRIAQKYEQLEPVFMERRQPAAQHPASPRQGQGLGHGQEGGGAVVEAPAVPLGGGGGAAAAAAASAARRRRHADAGGLPEPLLRFAEDLAAFATYAALTPVASLRYADPPTASSMVAGAAFDRDDEFFAVAGVSKRIKIFEREAVLRSCVGAHYPVLEISSRSRLSSVTWSDYIKGHLASADYEGVVQLWDANTNTELMQFEEHRKRVWSIDFSQADPARLLSGGDDGLVKLWSIQQETSTATIDLRANVCSVQFSPTSPHVLAAGCANYRIFLYDIRHTGRPLHVLPGHSRAVSYVRFLSATQLVSASTDNTLRLWQLDRTGPDGLPRCVQVFRGHINERNFTGLAVSPDGYISCGSENNRVFCYHQSMPMPVAWYDFASCYQDGMQQAHHLPGAGGEVAAAVGGGVMVAAGGAGAGPGGAAGGGLGGPASSLATSMGAAGGAADGGSAGAGPAGQFVSSVCWSRRSNLLLAANSVGFIKLFALH